MPPFTTTPDEHVAPLASVGNEEDKKSDREWRKRRVRWGSELHDKLVQSLREDMEFSLRGKQDRDEMARRSYKAFRCALDLSKHDMLAKVVDSRWFTTVHTAICAEMQALFASPSFLSYRPRGTTDAAKAKLFSKLFDYYWSERAPYEPVYELILQRTLFGTAYAFVYWNEQWRDIGRYEDVETPVMDVDEMGNEFQVSTVPERKFVRSEQKVRDAPWWDPIHFLDAYPDWESPSIEEARFFIHSKIRTREYVRQMAASGAWDKAMVERALETPWAGDEEGVLVGKVNDVIRWQQEVNLLSSNSVADAKNGDLFEVTQRWTQKGLTTYLNRTYVVDHGPNPYAHGEIPVVKITALPMPREHYGMMPFEPVEKELAHLNTMRSASATEARLSVHPVLMVGPGVKGDQLLYSPGKQWRVSDPAKDIVPLSRPTTGIEVAENQAAASRALIDDALATSEALRGTLPGREQTAAAVNTSVQGSKTRSGNGTRLFREQFSRKIGDWYRSMVMQFLDQQIPLRLTDDPNASAVLVGHDDIYDADLDTEPVPSDGERDEIEVKRLIDTATMTANFAELGQYINWKEFLSVIFEKLSPQHAARVMKSDEQLQQEQMAAQQQQQQAMMQQQQPPGAPPPNAPPGQANMENMRGGPPPSTGGRLDKGNDGGTEQLAKEQAAAVTL